MPAPTGNTNAAKWTLEATLEKLQKIEDYAHDEDVLTLGQALSWARLYPGVWSYWKQRWADNDEVMEQIYFIDHCFVTKLMHGALTKRLHAGMAMFALRVNHGISDKSPKEVEQPLEDKIPPHLAKELDHEDQKKNAPPLPARYAGQPHIYTTVPPSDKPYRRIAENVYTIYSHQFCFEEDQRFRQYQKKHGAWADLVLAPLDIDHTQMEIEAVHAARAAA